MTREQKINWLANADNEKLLKQFESSSRNANNVFEVSARYNLSVEEIIEDYELVKAEILKRMTAK